MAKTKGKKKDVYEQAKAEQAAYERKKAFKAKFKKGVVAFIGLILAIAMILPQALSFFGMV